MSQNMRHSFTWHLPDQQFAIHLCTAGGRHVCACVFLTGELPFVRVMCVHLLYHLYLHIAVCCIFLLEGTGTRAVSNETHVAT